MTYELNNPISRECEGYLFAVCHISLILQGRLLLNSRDAFSQNVRLYEYFLKNLKTPNEL